MEEVQLSNIQGKDAFFFKKIVYCDDVVQSNGESG
jgi:hypothetical protein